MTQSDTQPSARDPLSWLPADYALEKRVMALMAAGRSSGSGRPQHRHAFRSMGPGEADQFRAVSRNRQWARFGTRGVMPGSSNRNHILGVLLIVPDRMMIVGGCFLAGCIAIRGYRGCIAKILRGPTPQLPHGDEATIHRDELPGDEMRRVAGQKHQYRGQIVGRVTELSTERDLYPRLPVVRGKGLR
jgi:hypothetical protein